MSCCTVGASVLLHVHLKLDIAFMDICTEWKNTTMVSKESA